MRDRFNGGDDSRRDTDLPAKNLQYRITEDLREGFEIFPEKCRAIGGYAAKTGHNWHGLADSTFHSSLAGSAPEQPQARPPCQNAASSLGKGLRSWLPEC